MNILLTEMKITLMSIICVVLLCDRVEIILNVWNINLVMDDLLERIHRYQVSTVLAKQD